MIGVLDVGIGNQGSLRNAVYNLGHDWTTVTTPADLAAVTHLILPGVGAFPEAMRRLGVAGLISPLRDYAASGRPLLGICLGMQLFADSSDELGGAVGLGFIPGRVVRLRGDNVRVPHMGWNDITFVKHHPVTLNLKSGVDFYFVHSYRYVCAEDDAVFGITEHGEKFPAAIGRENVVGVQFHPEKSQTNGLALLDNFFSWDGRC